MLVGHVEPAVADVSEDRRFEDLAEAQSSTDEARVVRRIPGAVEGVVADAQLTREAYGHQVDLLTEAQLTAGAVPDAGLVDAADVVEVERQLRAGVGVLRPQHAGRDRRNPQSSNTSADHLRFQHAYS